MRCKRQWWIFAAVLALGACGSDDDNGGGGNGTAVTLSGQVRLLSSDGETTDVGSDVTVEAWTDVNGDGQISDGERASTTTSGDGSFSLKAPAKAGATMVVRFSIEGYAPVIRAVQMASVRDLHLDAVLSELAVLSCEAGRCRTDDGQVAVEGLEVASGYARAFNPVTDTDQFPGPFADDQGNMLVSGVFAAFALRDENDKPITDLGGRTATIRLAVPRDTWAEIRDTQTGDGKITVPMYSFDEVRGIWVRDGEGHLEDGTGGLLAEEDLAALRDGSFAGAVYAVAEVSHFSYWNVDWPVEAHTCVTGVVKDSSGRPAAGAQVTLFGQNYVGNSGPVVVSEDGRFCLPVPRSEAGGEDWNDNGVAGETFEFSVLVRYQDQSYMFGPLETPDSQAACPDGCKDLGDLVLDSDSLLQPELCHVTGTAVIQDSGVDLYAYAESRMLSDEDRERLCSGDETCLPEAPVGGDGSFELTAPMLGDITVSVVGTASDAVGQYHYRGGRTFRGCPSDPVTIMVNLASCFVNLPAVTFDPASQQISWDPDLPVAGLMVVDALTGEEKWAVVASQQPTFTGPVTYGQVPAGAVQAYPPSGEPAPVATGDTINVVPPNGELEYQGRTCVAQGYGVVP